uniref:Zinc finger PHD-type domain-containing protein n=2 Tax=Rhizophora mucronata TaxID=61149 RepID=A0A2P2JZ08_RHIMU
MALTDFKKRKRTPQVLTIHSLASLVLHGSFRENIREFLKKRAGIEDYSVGGSPVWCTLFESESGDVVFPLYTVEVAVERAAEPLCNPCRCVGWGHHFVSKRSYHMIIPEGEEWKKHRWKLSLELEEHLFHAVIHCNGFGHLLCINKIEENSKHPHGEELMNLWDNLCTILQTREISVLDLSKKGSMDLRLLFGVACRRPWFGYWGYKFCRGSFGVTEQHYERAIDILSSIDLDKIVHDFSKTKNGKLIEEIIQTYRDATESQLVTIGDLLQFMLTFKSKSPVKRKKVVALVATSSKISSKTIPQDKIHVPSDTSHKGKTSKRDSLASFVAKMDGRWPSRRLEYAVNVIADTLEANGAEMCRQELRDAVREHIGDTGLIDYVLKSINKVTVGNRTIHRAINPTTRLLEFSLKPVANGKNSGIKMEEQTDVQFPEPALHVNEDLLFLYNNVILGYPNDHLVSIATSAILNSKHFVKKWQVKGNAEDTLLRLVCQVRPTYDELVEKLTRPLPPGELVVLPQSVGASELKAKLQCALRDTYCIMDKFTVSDIKIAKLKGREGQDLLSYAAEQGLLAWVTGYGLDLSTSLRYEGGIDDWKVDCLCGARDDDGESMVLCHVCHVRQHTECNNIIEKDEAPPSAFACDRCSRGKKH